MKVWMIFAASSIVMQVFALGYHVVATAKARTDREMATALVDAIKFCLLGGAMLILAALTSGGGK